MRHQRNVEIKNSLSEAQHFNCNLIEVKFASSDETAAGEMIFSGYGAVFGNVDSYGDVIQKGAFKETLREAKKSGQWPVMLLQHGGWGMADEMMPPGIWLDMEEDDIGLKVQGKLADTDRGIEAYKLMKMTPRPAISGMSIGYIAKKFTVGTKPGEPRRLLEKIELMEVSLVTFPANGKARIQSVKSDLTIRIAEQALRDAGFSRTEAKSILANGFKAVPPRDAEDYGELAALIRRNTEILST
ncbi:MAG: peptidase U35 [Gallionellales bacterium 35-53-114]|jgi:HK97 family phage prohead protease|nr:MAG: peptidase U35 [Gallionellales bacterium 35-53-114]OYZ65088.1 MAG: peptidase U35 [Gallionellales bacterium 24-53-125]OZB07997.1 MAG: peptidase U35 [Gallionellales bacterium 39-52-133]HQS59738.1 HK97 family phage prohead protease [Gallionellaceae bacterium]HQS76492.1 HK97 family phage prohead protease [Gallionellaceae bacterium]